MLKAHERAEVDILDRLPTPFGLTRSGVALDHPETKIVVNQFTRVTQNDRCMFLGNVNLESSVSLKELRDLYHVVLLAYGAEVIAFLGSLGRKLSMGEEWIDMREKDEELQNVQPIRRSISMDLSVDREFSVEIQQCCCSISNNISRQRCEISSTSKVRRYIFSFSYGRSSRGSVQPLHLDP